MISSESSLKIGTVLNNGEWRYKIIDVLGQGGFGITYLAIGEVKVGNVTTDAKFAIKEHFPNTFCNRQGQSVVPKEDKVLDFARSKSDFISEAKKIHALGAENENIVKVNEVFEENQTAYYVMQYINGVSLTDYVKSKKKLTYNEALSLLLPIINAVNFLHKSRINHLDIKPDNIMLHDSIDGKVPILIDFGLSVHFKKNGDKTSPKGVMGVSEGYSPLEQYAGIKEFNPATDIYALAATMLYALNGVTPKGASDLKLSEVRTNLAKLASQQAIDALCKALNKSYEDRTSSVNAFKADLGVVGTGGQDTEPINPDDPKRKKYQITGISIVAIIAVVICCVNMMNKHKPEPQPVSTPVEANDSISTDEAEAAAIPAKEERQENTESGQLAQNNQIEQSGNNNRTQYSTSSQTQHQTSHQMQQQVEPIKPVVTTGTLSLGYATWRGGIKNGKPDGKGRMTFTSTHKVDRRSSVEANSGDYFDATYENGSLISGKLYDSDGNLLKTIIP
ncbi:MAG: serine/threonine protein kinase [Bacteroides sp.]|nr:serine/threonine protein kinase [Bacteroides sp.]